MRQAYVLPVLGMLSCLTAGCSQDPTVHYKRFPADSAAMAPQSSSTTSPPPRLDVKAGSADVPVPATKQPADPADNEFSFALPISSVVLSLPTVVANSAPKRGEPPAPTVPDTSSTPKKGVDKKAAASKPVDKKAASNQSPAPSPSTPAPVADVATSKSLETRTQLDCTNAGNAKDGRGDYRWIRCFDNVNTAVAPHPDADYIYAALPADSLGLTITTGASPLQVTTIKSNWTNPTSTAVGRIGENAVLGYGVGGPIGAAVVAIGGEIAYNNPKSINFTLTSSVGETEKLQVDTWGVARTAGFICKGESEDAPPDDETKLNLLLPVALDLDGTLPDGKGCWHRFPKGDNAYTNNGWLYRILDERADASSTADSTAQLVPPVIDVRKPGASASDLDIYDSTQKPTATGLPPDDTNHAWFPTSACHAVRLEVTWWKEAATKAAPYAFNPKDHPTSFDVAHVLPIHIVIADPRYVQKMSLPKGPRTINIGDCGGTATGVASANEAMDDFNAVTKLVKDVRDAQQSWNKDHAKK